MSGQPENFLSWEQIAPLVRPGMTFRELGDAVLTQLGLSHGQYRLVTVARRRDDEPINLREGVLVITKEQGDERVARNISRLSPKEVVA